MSSGQAGRLVVVGCVLCCVAIELVTATGFVRVSRIQARTAREWAAALQPPSSDAVTVQIVGNSLLGSGVRLQLLRDLLGPDYDPRRLVVEDTRFLDWRFGLRRLVRDGARPPVAILMLSERQLLDDGFRGDYAAHYLFTLPDTVAAGRAVGADRTRLAGLVLANLSSYWGSRAEIRKWLLGVIAPPVPALLQGLRRPSRTQWEPPGAYALSKSRIAELARELAGVSCRLWVVLPPRTEDSALTGTIQKAGVDAGVPVIVPIPPGRLGGKYFEDGQHLNQAGAELFTRALAGEIRQAVRQALAVRSGS